jgi:molybdate transport system ATP-binding protein
VAIARALLSSPSLLLMDEPLLSLDSSRRAEILPFIGGICREFKLPILYVSHSPDEVISLADKLVFMDSGRVIASGNIKELIKRPDLRCLMGKFGTLSLPKNYDPG